MAHLIIAICIVILGIQLFGYNPAVGGMKMV